MAAPRRSRVAETPRIPTGKRQTTRTLGVQGGGFGRLAESVPKYTRRADRIAMITRSAPSSGPATSLRARVQRALAAASVAAGEGPTLALAIATQVSESLGGWLAAWAIAFLLIGLVTMLFVRNRKPADQNSPA